MSRRAAVLTLVAVTVGGASLASAAVIQQGNLRITALAQVKPFKLPRAGTAPIAVFIAGHIGTTSGGLPPQLRSMTVKVNRHGLLRSQGLPTCTLPAIATASTRGALNRCADALVGSGRFWATVVFPDQRPYPTRGRLLVFNGISKVGRVLLAHIFTKSPFATSFVIPFAIKHIDGGQYGTELIASFPAALGDWGFVDRIKLTLRRKFVYRGKQRSYFNAGCPAPRGADATVFPLALASFEFAESREIRLSIEKSCRVKT